ENLQAISRREAYQCDILYGTNNEFGFDYLRDNMVWDTAQKAQRPLYYAIVDEVDSILIDEARTPLIISAPDEESAKLYERFARIVPRLKENEDYNIDHKMRSAALTDSGIDKVEKELGMGNIYEEGKISFVHHLEEALRAQALFKKDRDYVVKNGEVIIVDDFTGRLMAGRRYSGGLHQAIEAKEGVAVQKESKTMATITFQNYFRLYKKLAGMTGTAATSAEEFFKVYKLEVIVAPTNKKMIRIDMPDRIYKTEKGKFKAVAEEIKARHKSGQPVLVGTISIGKSEILSAMLIREGLAHEVLNAKNHEREAAIIAKAGERGAITIATNMAGRGTDIKLGKGVANSGGLHVLGTERHEARRIDNQLRGRAGRQGDPGSSQFFVSLEDELMRILGAERIKSLMDTLGVEEDQPIEAQIISKIIGDAQAKIEGYNFDLRKHILEYDDVMNKHREIIYGARNKFLSGKEPLKQEVMKILASEAEKVVLFHTQGGRSAWDMKEIAETMAAILGSPAPIKGELKGFYESHGDEEEIRKKIIGCLSGLLAEKYEEREKRFGAEVMRQIEKAVVLNMIDLLWVEHLETVEHLRQGIGLRGYGQKDPLIEYKKEAYNLFQKLLAAINSQIANTIFKVAVQPAKNQFETAPPQNNSQQPLVYSGAASAAEPPAQDNLTKKKEVGLPAEVRGTKAGRNAPCPCGASKPDGRPIKYKHCHGKNA
ncbi:preprotein translocase subunit SecA, partial [Patescibacteria group bacterium]|nr:preprotein translocase subunit SecA [Patescibacteria group bacterium]